MTWSPEISLLLSATSPYPDEKALTRIHRQVTHELDWSELLRIAIPHGVLPLLSHNLSGLAASAVPPITLAQLQLYGKQVAERNQEQSPELVKIVSGFTHEDIRVMPFKGPALAITSYGDISARESHDLDLWVDPLQVARAHEWFRESGYHPAKHVKGVAQEVSTFAEGHGDFSIPIVGYSSKSEVILRSRRIQASILRSSRYGIVGETLSLSSKSRSLESRT